MAVLAKPTAPRRKWSSLQRQEAAWALFFLAPDLLGFLTFTLLPVVAALVLGFMKWDLIVKPVFIGLGNYRTALSDQAFRNVVVNTVYYTLGTVPTGIVLSLLLALALNQKLRGVAILRTLFYLPVVSSIVAIALVWRWLYNSDFGIFNLVLTGIGLPRLGWLTSPTWAMPAVIIMSIWKNLGYNMVIFLAGLQGIPVHLYEAAAVDGASPWRCFWAITLPMLSPTTFFVLVMSLIGSFQVFSQVYIMTAGGPGNATSTIVYYIFQNAFQWFKMGYASALAWILFAIIFTFTLVQFRYQREWVHYE